MLSYRTQPSVSIALTASEDLAVGGLWAEDFGLSNEHFQFGLTLPDPLPSTLAQAGGCGLLKGAVESK